MKASHHHLCASLEYFMNIGLSWAPCPLLTRWEDPFPCNEDAYFSPGRGPEPLWYPWWDFFLSFSSLLSKWLPFAFFNPGYSFKCQIDVTNCLWDVSMWLCHYELKPDVPKIKILHKCFLASSLWLHTIEFLFVTFHFATKTEEIKTDLTSLLLLAFVSKSVTVSIM